MQSGSATEPAANPAPGPLAEAADLLQLRERAPAQAAELHLPRLDGPSVRCSTRNAAAGSRQEDGMANSSLWPAAEEDRVVGCGGVRAPP